MPVTQPSIHNSVSTCRHAIPEPACELDLHVLGNEAIVYSATHDTVHYLNTTAYRVWQLCDGIRRLYEIADAVVDAHVPSRNPSRNDADGDPDTILTDVTRIIMEFAQSGLVRFRSEPAS